MAELKTVADEVVDVAVDVVDLAEDTMREIAQAVDTRIAVAAVAVGVVVGFGLGYVVAVKKLGRKYEQMVAEEVVEMQLHYKRANDVKVEIDREKPALDKVVAELGYVAPSPVAQPLMIAPVIEKAEAEEQVLNVFAQPQPEIPEQWDFAEEAKKRQPGVPYVIHQSEIEEDEHENVINLTYFEGDDVLANQADEALDQEDTIGLAALSRFGQGSGDDNIVYVRNEEYNSVYEVVKSYGTYAQEVHGFDPTDELQHSDRRIRFDDDQ